jgi:hypothetical protein
LHLFKSSQDISLNNAYSKALFEFYQARKEQELKEREAQQIAYETGMALWKEERLAKEAQEKLEEIPDTRNVTFSSTDPLFSFGRPATEAFMEMERKELEQGLLYRKELNK